MNILYIGSSRGTSLERFKAIQRLGHDADMVDPLQAVPDFRAIRSWSARTGGLGFEKMVRSYVLSKISGKQYDLVFVDSGELIAAELVRSLKRQASAVVNYNPDNPYSSRDGNRWRLFKRTLVEYDALFVPRFSNVIEARAAGAKHVHRVWFAADDALVDYYESESESDQSAKQFEVAFVGTWMPERGPLLARLLTLGVPLKILGPRWDRAPEYSYLKSSIVLGGLDTAEYNRVLYRTKVAIALLSKGNRDLHTTRSIEIPLLGSVLCAERTVEHSELYDEGTEAIFWSTAEECAESCLRLLRDEEWCSRLSVAGRNRAIRNGHFNSQLMVEMIAYSASISRISVVAG